MHSFIYRMSFPESRELMMNTSLLHGILPAKLKYCGKILTVEFYQPEKPSFYN